MVNRWCADSFDKYWACDVPFGACDVPFGRGGEC